MAGRSVHQASLAGDGFAEQLFGKRVTPDFFEVLGVRPIVGRTFTTEEDRSTAQVALISYSLWQRRYGGEKSIIGRGILLDGVKAAVIM